MGGIFLNKMPATIHMDDLAGDVSGTGEQKQERFFYFIFVCPSPERDILKNIRIFVSIRGRQDGAERQSIDGDFRGQRNCQRLCQGCQGGFADRIGEVVGPGTQRPPVQDVDDPSAGLGLSGKCLAEQERRGQVDLQVLLPCLQGGRLQGKRAKDRRAIDEGK